MGAQPPVTESSPKDRYDPAFFEDLRQGAFESAREIVPYLITLLQPTSVLDVGCGVGAWLAVFMEHNIEDILGVDGNYLRREQLVIPPAKFVAADLSHTIDLRRRFDLVITLEVAEHLPATSSATFVDALTAHGTAIFFSAAVPGQGGTHHVNEQWPEYWKGLFEARNFVLIDCLRYRFWDNVKVAACYRQNMMLYVDRNRLTADPNLRCEYERRNGSPLSLVHPEVFAAALRRPLGLRKLVHAVPRAVSESVRARAARVW